jgi:hypothetical protein
LKETPKAVSNESDVLHDEVSVKKCAAVTSLDKAAEDKKPGSVLKQRSLTSFFKK